MGEAGAAGGANVENAGFVALEKEPENEAEIAAAIMRKNYLPEALPVELFLDVCRTENFKMKKVEKSLKENHGIRTLAFQLERAAKGIQENCPSIFAANGVAKL